MFVWDDKYSVGIEEIDNQHRYFFELANKVYKAIEDSTINSSELLILLSEFEKYAQFHFITEENYFVEFNYGDKVPHVAEHNKYRETVSSMMERCRGDNLNLNVASKELADFAVEWLKSHILSSDYKYAEVFRSHGVK